jgi:hypothetical protein
MYGQHSVVSQQSLKFLHLLQEFEKAAVAMFGFQQNQITKYVHELNLVRLSEKVVAKD